jgi:hypothetical protein
MSEAARPEPRACQTCFHWDPLGDKVIRGRCLRFPPTGEGSWPTTKAGDVCGEWKENEAGRLSPRTPGL